MRHRLEKTSQLVFLLILFFLPLFVEAAVCSDQGYTAVFINGVFDTKDHAQENKRSLKSKLGGSFNNESITYVVGYNQTHLAGIGDFIETNFPVFDDYDLNTILMQMHADVTTRKILLVGHSQGSVYANKIYEYLVAHGVPAQDVAVYAVATPASYVARGGKYITYTVGQGHSFIDIYLGGFGTRTVGDMQGAMAQLASAEGTAKDGCFDPPGKTLAYRAQRAT